MDFQKNIDIMRQKMTVNYFREVSRGSCLMLRELMTNLINLKANNAQNQ